MTYLDTHVVAWLHAGRTDLLSPRASQSIEEDELIVSPMVLLELEFLREVGKTADGPDDVLHELQQRLGLKVCSLPFSRVIGCAVLETWTRDPFDRLIVGQAQAGRAGLLTKDRTILDQFPRAFW